VDYVCRNEFDYSVKELAEGAPLSSVRGIVYRAGDDTCRHTAARSVDENLDALPWVTRVYKRDLDNREVQHPVDALAVRVHLHHARVPGPVHVLPLAADDERAPVQQAVGRRRHRRDDLGEGEPPRREGVFLRR
jgi:hypothetical protein